MITEETVDLTVWTLREIGEMEVAARGFIHGMLSVTPYEARDKIRLKYRFNKAVSIHVNNSNDPAVIQAFGYHVESEEGVYGDEVFLCEIEAYTVEHDRHGLNILSTSN